MTTMRVFLHDLAWQQDAKGYRERINRFLDIAAKHHIKPLFVLFDSCWDPNPKLGQAARAEAGRAQLRLAAGSRRQGAAGSEGVSAAQNVRHGRRGGVRQGLARAWLGRLERTRQHEHEQLWQRRSRRTRSISCSQLLPQVFAWAREAGAEQPLTSGVWKGDWSSDDKLSPMERIQLEHSDVISFHNYDNGAEFEKRIPWLQRFHRPILCTEYMARGNGSTFQGSLPIAKKYKVAAINWGFVAGKTQTYLPWDSWQKPYVDREPTVWFHEIFKQDGTPYKQDEVDLIRKLTGAGAGR